MKEVSLKNYVEKAVSNTEMDAFLDLVIKKVRKARDDNDEVKIDIIGWADGTKNGGLTRALIEEVSGVKISSECSDLIKQPLVYDETLSLLRGCEVQQKISSIIIDRRIPVKLNPKVEGRDEPTGENATGDYRKVVVYIKY